MPRSGSFNSRSPIEQTVSDLASIQSVIAGPDPFVLEVDKLGTETMQAIIDVEQTKILQRLYEIAVE